MRRAFQQVDVFGSGPCSGNPVAVVLDGAGLDDTAMQRFARWTNLSETTFVLPPRTSDGDYRLRIFTPAAELPFAGHPTLGSCHAWLASGATPGRAGRIVQECAAGPIVIRREDGALSFAAPPLLRSGPPDAAVVERIAGILQLPRAGIVDAQWTDNGPGWVSVLLESADAVLALQPDLAAAAGLPDFKIGIVGPCPAGAECAFEVRALFGDGQGGLREDPVTGSLNAALAQWLIASGRAVAPYQVGQGTRLGRSGRVRVRADAEGQVWIGGNTRTVVDGHVDL